MPESKTFILFDLDYFENLGPVDIAFIQDFPLKKLDFVIRVECMLSVC